MKKILFTLLFCAVFAWIANAADPMVSCREKSGKVLFQCGEYAELILKGENLPPEAKEIVCKVFENGKNIETKKIAPNETFTVRRTMNAPGWLAVTGSVYDANGKLLRKLHPLNSSGKNLIGGVGVMFEPEKIKPARECPADFEEFWKKQREEVNKVPMEVTKTEVKVPERFKNSRTRCYDVKITCAGDMPVSGYLCIPQNAKQKSYPVMVYPDGAGVRSSYLSAWWSKGIIFSFNAHGIENGKDKAFYSNLEKTSLHKYPFKGAGDRDTWYFRRMFQRLMRALDYVKTIPEWDGKNLIVSANSMGGAQALAAAALDHDITLCMASIPAFGDLNGPAPAYPKVKGDYTAYYDTANFAKFIRCPVFFSAGLIDFTCSPYSIFCAYNAIPADVPKQIRLYPNFAHEGRCKPTLRDQHLKGKYPTPSGRILIEKEEVRK